MSLPVSPSVSSAGSVLESRVTRRLRLAVLVSGRGSNFVALLDAIDAGRCSAEVVGVVADRAMAPALQRAAERRIPHQVVPFRGGAERSRWDAELVEAVAVLQPDLVVLAGFMRIVSAAFVERFAPGILNVHPALLPAFPGAHAVADALAAGVRISGCTVHLVDQGVDTGAIVAQAAVAVAIDDDEVSLHQRIQRAEHQLLPAVVQHIATGALRLGSRPLWDAEAPLESAIFSPAIEHGIVGGP